MFPYYESEGKNRVVHLEFDTRESRTKIGISPFCVLICTMAKECVSNSLLCCSIGEDGQCVFFLRLSNWSNRKKALQGPELYLELKHLAFPQTRVWRRIEHTASGLGICTPCMRILLPVFSSYLSEGSSFVRKYVFDLSELLIEGRCSSPGRGVGLGIIHIQVPANQEAHGQSDHFHAAILRGNDHFHLHRCCLM